MRSILYTVEPGDTLWSIARNFGTTVNDILRFNPMIDPNRLSPGQRLRVPVGTPPMGMPPMGMPPMGMPPIPKWHTVQPGDTLFNIAQRHGLDFNELISINHIEPPHTIYPGQLIMLHNF